MDDSTTLSIGQLRTNLSQIIGQVMYGNKRAVIKKYNREAAVIISKDEYEKLLDPTKRFSRLQWDRKFAFFNGLKERLKDQDQEELEEEIDNAVKEVRAEKRSK